MQKKEKPKGRERKEKGKGTMKGRMKQGRKSDKRRRSGETRETEITRGNKKRQALRGFKDVEGGADEVGRAREEETVECKGVRN